MPNMICVSKTIQCHARRRKSSGLILQNVKNSMKNISGGNKHVRWRNSGKPTTPTNMANANALRSKNDFISVVFILMFDRSRCLLLNSRSNF